MRCRLLRRHLILDHLICYVDFRGLYTAVKGIMFVPAYLESCLQLSDITQLLDIKEYIYQIRITRFFCNSEVDLDQFLIPFKKK